MEFLFIELPWSEMRVFWPGVLLLGYTAGVLTGMFGTGGGFLLTPLLRYVFDVPFEIAVGTSLCAIAVASVAGVVSHARLGHVFPRLGSILLCGAVPGVEIGVRILELLRTRDGISGAENGSMVLDTVMGVCYVILLSLTAVMMFREAARYRTGQNRTTPVVRNIETYSLRYFVHPFNKLCCLDPVSNLDAVNVIAIFTAGLVTGVLSGFLGVGGGFIMTPTLISIFGLPAVIAVGTGLFQIMVTSAVGSVAHGVRGNVDFFLAALIVAGSIAGTFTGAKITPLIRGRMIRLLFALFLAATAVFVLIQLMIR
jgi:uncharacterized protein